MARSADFASVDAIRDFTIRANNRIFRLGDIADVRRATAVIDEELSAVEQLVDVQSARTLVGVAGTVTTVAALLGASPVRGLARLNAIASNEFPSAPTVKIKPVSLKESPRTLSRKFGVSG